MITSIAPPGCCRSPARRSATAGSPSTAAGSSRRPVDPPRPPASSATRAVDRGARRDPARPRQRAHASRAVLDARQVPPATRCRRGSRALMALRAAASAPEPPAPIVRRAIAEARASRARRSSATSRNTLGRRRRCWRDSQLPAARVPRAARLQCRRIPERSWRRAGRSSTALTPVDVAAAVDRAARAVLGVAGAVPRDRAARCAARPIERPPRRVAGGSASSCATAAGAWRDAARGARRLERRWTAAGCGPVEYLDRLGLCRTAAARRARRAARRTTSWRGWPTRRRDARDLSAQQPLDGRGRRRRSSGSTRRASAWRSAPTAWPASRI